MKTRFLLAIALSCAFLNLSAQTENYDPDGTYWGEPVHSISVDFTQFPIDALPNPIESNDIYELANLGLIRFCIQSRPIGEGEYQETVNTLFNNNPTVDGETNGAPGGVPGIPATIYFPTLKDGAGTIRIKGWVATANGRGVGLSYANPDGPDGWSYIVGVIVPGTGIGGYPWVEYEINMEGPVNLKLAYANTSYLMFARIDISAFGEDVPPLTSGINPPKLVAGQPVLAGDALLLGDEKANVFFYNYTGQLLFTKTNVNGEVVLPAQAGIVKVVRNSGTSVLKK